MWSVSLCAKNFWQDLKMAADKNQVMKYHLIFYRLITA
jgi:hypothetical protein